MSYNKSYDLIEIFGIINMGIATIFDEFYSSQVEIWDKMHFKTAAIFNFKMVAEDVLGKNGTLNFWNQHPQIDKVSQ